MKKLNFKDIRIRKVDPSELDDTMLLVNLYATQAITLIVGICIVFFQSQKWSDLIRFPEKLSAWGCAAVFAAAVLAFDWLIARWVPEDVTDDGGVNQKLFGRRPLWHIAVISLVVAICEELLFRGAIQHAFGPYWTSILFAAIHIRYLRHWLMTGMVFAISYGLGKLYVLTGSLWAPIAAHFLIDFVMGCIIRYRRDEVDGER
ncbi:CPBP family intramembrane glutamic endopeptidase [Paenibacillus flagellatus]|uniref:CPBP family intramembrane metalloprotease n=1 Tax=Paenibacillus flagellatus TaxID=2211139 RepID=A0A2V5K6D5_9BACL|nr:CPBP family intramembrane glutamic endopeptidase [Paenibacillus flagellatus]PYI54969.1 CPBP family intramembrane metalloprotease [Paenibacillus flagellatus]